MNTLAAPQKPAIQKATIAWLFVLLVCGITGHITVASDLSAGKDLALIGKSVDLSAAQDTSTEHSAQQSAWSGASNDCLRQ